jgi:cytochrome c biogenesis protein CcmG/thiol:disulfide interchange protein DsbE
MNRNVIFVLCVVVAITGLLLVGKRATKPPETASAANQGAGQEAPPPAQGATYPHKGAMAPTFELKSIPEGKSIALASLRGKPVLLNFWATWCGPCKIEMPWLVDLQKKYGPEGLQIVGVAMDDTDDKDIADFAHKMGVNYIVLKGTEKVGDLYGGIEGLPTTYYLDRSGKVVDVTIGLASESVIEDAIKKSLAQGN